MESLYSLAQHQLAYINDATLSNSVLHIYARMLWLLH